MATAAPATPGNGKFEMCMVRLAPPGQQHARRRWYTVTVTNRRGGSAPEACFSPWSPISESEKPQYFLLSSFAWTLFAAKHFSKEGLGDLGCLLGCVRDSQGIQPTSLWFSFSASKTGVVILTLSPPCKTALQAEILKYFGNLMEVVLYLYTHILHQLTTVIKTIMKYFYYRNPT